MFQKNPKVDLHYGDKWTSGIISGKKEKLMIKLQ